MKWFFEWSWFSKVMLWTVNMMKVIKILYLLVINFSGRIHSHAERNAACFAQQEPYFSFIVPRYNCSWPGSAHEEKVKIKAFIKSRYSWYIPWIFHIIWSSLVYLKGSMKMLHVILLESRCLFLMHRYIAYIMNINDVK